MDTQTISVTPTYRLFPFRTEAPSNGEETSEFEDIDLPDELAGNQQNVTLPTAEHRFDTIEDYDSVRIEFQPNNDQNTPTGVIGEQPYCTFEDYKKNDSKIQLASYILDAIDATSRYDAVWRGDQQAECYQDNTHGSVTASAGNRNGNRSEVDLAHNRKSITMDRYLDLFTIKPEVPPRTVDVVNEKEGRGLSKLSDEKFENTVDGQTFIESRGTSRDSQHTTNSNICFEPRELPYTSGVGNRHSKTRESMRVGIFKDSHDTANASENEFSEFEDIPYEIVKNINKLKFQSTDNEMSEFEDIPHEVVKNINKLTFQSTDNEMSEFEDIPHEVIKNINKAKFESTDNEMSEFEDIPHEVVKNINKAKFESTDNGNFMSEFEDIPHEVVKNINKLTFQSTDNEMSEFEDIPHEVIKNINKAKFESTDNGMSEFEDIPEDVVAKPTIKNFDAIEDYDSVRIEFHSCKNDSGNGVNSAFCQTTPEETRHDLGYSIQRSPSLRKDRAKGCSSTSDSSLKFVEQNSMIIPTTIHTETNQELLNESNGLANRRVGNRLQVEGSAESSGLGTIQSRFRRSFVDCLRTEKRNEADEQETRGDLAENINDIQTETYRTFSSTGCQNDIRVGDKKSRSRNLSDSIVGAGTFSWRQQTGGETPIGMRHHQRPASLALRTNTNVHDSLKNSSQVRSIPVFIAEMEVQNDDWKDRFLDFFRSKQSRTSSADFVNEGAEIQDEVTGDADSNGISAKNDRTQSTVVGDIIARPTTKVDTETFDTTTNFQQTHGPNLLDTIDGNDVGSTREQNHVEGESKRTILGFFTRKTKTNDKSYTPTSDFEDIPDEFDKNTQRTFVDHGGIRIRTQSVTDSPETCPERTRGQHQEPGISGTRCEQTNTRAELDLKTKPPPMLAPFTENEKQWVANPIIIKKSPQVKSEQRNQETYFIKPKSPHNERRHGARNEKLSVARSQESNGDSQVDGKTTMTMDRFFNFFTTKPKPQTVGLIKANESSEVKTIPDKLLENNKDVPVNINLTNGNSCVNIPEPTGSRDTVSYCDWTRRFSIPENVEGKVNSSTCNQPTRESRKKDDNHSVDGRNVTTIGKFLDFFTRKPKAKDAAHIMTSGELNKAFEFEDNSGEMITYTNYSPSSSPRNHSLRQKQEPYLHNSNAADDAALPRCQTAYPNTPATPVLRRKKYPNKKRVVRSTTEDMPIEDTVLKPTKQTLAETSSSATVWIGDRGAVAESCDIRPSHKGVKRYTKTRRSFTNFLRLSRAERKSDAKCDFGCLRSTSSSSNGFGKSKSHRLHVGQRKCHHAEGGAPIFSLEDSRKNKKQSTQDRKSSKNHSRLNRKGTQTRDRTYLTHSLNSGTTSKYSSSEDEELTSSSTSSERAYFNCKACAVEVFACDACMRELMNCDYSQDETDGKMELSKNEKRSRKKWKIQKNIFACCLPCFYV